MIFSFQIKKSQLITSNFKNELMTTLLSTIPAKSKKSKKRRFGGFQSSHSAGNQFNQRLALIFCVFVLIAGIMEQFFHSRPAYAGTFAPCRLPLATLITIIGVKGLQGKPSWFRLWKIVCWSGLFLMLWTANGLPLDLLHKTGLMPPGIDWSGLITRLFALAATIVLVRLNLALPAVDVAPFQTTLYGYIAFLLSLPYAILRTIWAFGGTPGLKFPGAAGIGFVPWLASIPWLLAAILSLLLVSRVHWISRRLLHIVGWSATAIFALIGPSACWSLYKIGGRG
jgi:hypothetical protein